MSPIEQLRAAVRAGIEMREAQRAYFAERTRVNLAASKEAEQAFDKLAWMALQATDVGDEQTSA